MLPQAASDAYRAQQRLTVATLALTRTAWAQMDFDNLDASWARVGPKVLTVVTQAQLGAARNGVAYVPDVLDELGQSVSPDGLVSASAFAGVASDGRPLGSLLVGAKIHTKESGSLDSGRAWLDMVAQTMVADAFRQSAGVGTFVRKGAGYVRAANAPCCQRCAVLSGKFSRSDVPFKRHPHCDCINVPTTDPASITTPAIGPDDVKDLTRAQRKAIGEGADMNQVINSHRAGSRSKNGLTTTEGATRRGIAGKSLGAARGKRAARLTPEGIYRIASDRTEALRLLRQHGYVL